MELDETTYWLELLTESGIVPPAKLASLQDETNQLLAILTINRKVALNQQLKPLEAEILAIQQV